MITGKGFNLDLKNTKMRYLALLLVLSCSNGYNTVEEAICAACKADIERRQGVEATNYKCTAPGSQMAIMRIANCTYYLTGTKWYSMYHAYELVNIDTLRPDAYRLDIILDSEGMKPGELERTFEEIRANNEILNN